MRILLVWNLWMLKMATAYSGMCKCSSLYRDPRMLPCLHIFCIQCLTKAAEIQGARDSLKCPTCDENVALPEGGVKKLPRDLRKAEEAEIVGYGKKLEDGNEPCGICFRADSGPAVSFCVNCCEFLCKVCDEHHRSSRKTYKHEIINVDSVSKPKGEEDTQGCALVGKCHKPPMPCSVHDDEVLKFYCEKCEILICRDCMELDHSDHRSRCNRVEAVATKMMKELAPQVRNFKDMVITLNNAIAECEEGLNEVNTRNTEAQDAVTKHLSDVRDALILQANKLCVQKTTSLKMQVKELEHLRDAILRVSDTIDAFESYTPSQQLATTKVVSERLKVVQKKFNNTSAFPLVSTLLASKLDFPGVADKVILLGEIVGGCDPASSTCDISYIPRAVVSQERVVKVTARQNSDDDVFPQGGENVSGELVVSGKSMKGTSTDHGNGTYSVAFTTKSVGDCKFHVRIGGQPIKGSPFALKSRPARRMKFPGLYITPTCSNPNDIALTKEGSMAVAEYGSHTVSLYSEFGTLLHRFGTKGYSYSDTSGFYHPSGVAINGDILYVADRQSSYVKVVNLTKAKILSKFGQGKLQKPESVCTDPEGKVFVTDSAKNVVQVFQSDGTHAYTISGCDEDSNFYYPRGIAFDRYGFLHIVAHKSNCVKVFTPEGIFVESYGGGTFIEPCGIAIDVEGNVVITGANQDKVWIHKHGHAEQEILTHEYEHCPTGVAFDANGVLWISQYKKDHITKCSD